MPARLIEIMQYIYYTSEPNTTWNSLLQCPYCGKHYDFLRESHVPYSLDPERKCYTSKLKSSRGTRIETAQRTRQLQRRKRSVSVDGEGWRGPRTMAQEQSPLFSKLPAEVREMVFKALLCPAESVILIRGRMKGEELTRVVAMLPCSGQVLRTCRRLYHEAIGLLYSNNYFHFNKLAELLTFIRWIPAPRIHQIRTVTITNRLVSRYRSSFWGEYSMVALFALLPSMAGLEEVVYILETGEAIGMRYPLTSMKFLKDIKMSAECAVYYEIRAQQVTWVGGENDVDARETAEFGGLRVNERVRVL